MIRRIPGRLPGAVVLAIGVGLGWGLSSVPRQAVRASGGDRSGESIVATGPVLVRYNEGLKVQIPQEAVYLLDYKSGRLLGTVPTPKPSFGQGKMIGAFAERDLVADFKIDLDTGPRPHFLMTTGALGTYSEGWAPLYVFETTTGQVAVYKVQQQTVGLNTRSHFDLIELSSYARGAAAPAPITPGAAR